MIWEMPWLTSYRCCRDKLLSCICSEFTACLSQQLPLCGASGPICPRTSSLISLQVSVAPVGQPISGRLTQRRRRGLPGVGPAGIEKSLEVTSP